MSFKCNGCNKSFSDSKMAGLVFGQISRSLLESRGVLTEGKLTQGFSSGDFRAGFLSGLGVRCPSCDAKDWS